MSEEILKALTQLFAIITKQDEGVTEIERQFVEQFFKSKLSKDSVQEYLSLYEEFLVEKKKSKRRESSEEESDDSVSEDNDSDTEQKSERKAKLTSMKDSVRTLAICKKINKTLTQKQKVIVLIELLELVNSDNNFSPQREQIINTVSTVFNIENEEYLQIEKFVMSEDIQDFDHENYLISSESEIKSEKTHYINSEKLDGVILFLKVASVDLYFVKYLGSDTVFINSDALNSYRVSLFSYGSTIKPSKGASIYFSDLVSHFTNSHTITPLSFNCKDLEFQFPNGAIGLRDVNITENRGQLIGIMGASGAGKTTLLNVLAGIETPSKGSVLINGLNIHTQKELVKGVIGYIAQDDLLIEDLTVFENLYYNAKLCFKDKGEEEIRGLVKIVLENLGLEHIKHLKVGNALNKKISGGQRKRLNIALELIREPAVMFVDEPTSGLSSRDSENVIDLLKELSLKGKLIFVVIHQPSSDIYKKFDKMYFMDTGGYPIYYGGPIDAVVYFKEATNQINSDQGQCGECGNVNPEQIFDIIEARVVNEYGKLTNKRKVTPTQWSDLYKQSFNIKFHGDLEEAPPSSLKIPSKFKQWFIYTIRDIKSKISNTQYLSINLLEGPFLAFLLAFIIRYNDAPGDNYLFRYNENVPAYILISIVVSLFMGLSVSAEEIIRDRKIMKREQFLSLSRTSYLFSKVGILFLLSAIQTLTYVIVGNSILGIPGMTMTYWLILFSTSCFANMLGLNISASFNSAITVYILIPLLLIPQMILSGALFNFEKLNSLLSEKDKTPLIADMMASRWAYEAIAVEQHKSNEYEEIYFEIDKKISASNFQQAYRIPELENIINECASKSKDTLLVSQQLVQDNLALLKNELTELHLSNPDIPFDDLKVLLDSMKYSAALYVSGFEFLEKTAAIYTGIHTSESTKKDQITSILAKRYAKIDGMSHEYIKDLSFNESLDEIVRNLNTKARIERYNGYLVQNLDPIFKDPRPSNAVDYRAHLFAPQKHFAGSFYETYKFNILVIWLMSLVLYFTLYFDVFKKILGVFGKISLIKNDD